MNLDGLICADSLSTRQINLRKSEFLLKTVPSKDLDEHLDSGWEVVPSRLKTRIRIRKPKAHNVAFEDRVWALFARMGFDYINEDNQFKLAIDKELRKQIDVFAFDSETILVVECKSTKLRKRGVSYQTQINEINALKRALTLSAKKIAESKQKIAFLFCTNNVVLSDQDKSRLKKAKIFHFNQDVIEYYEQLSQHLGRAAKYQLNGQLFATQKIPELKNKIPAVRGKVSAGHTIYSFCIDPEYLLKIGFVLHRTETNLDASLAYQRLVRKPRLRKIAKYIENSGYFPNSIIINIETKSRRPLQFEEASKISHDGATDFGVLYLPKSYRSAFIIDGQHRLYGYSISETKSNHTIPVVAFHNLPAEEQADIFVDINQNQKSIPANLLQSIEADSNWGSTNDRQAISALKTRILTKLNYDEASSFYKRIRLAEEQKTQLRCLTIKTLKDWGLSRERLFGRLRGDKLIQNGYLHESTIVKRLHKAIGLFKGCFLYIEEELQEQWDLGSGEGGFIAMNLGVSATIRIIDDIVDFLAVKKQIDPFKMSGTAIAEKVIPYLAPVVTFINALDSQGIKKIRGKFGSGAAEKVQRDFQKAINNEYPDFNPDGLDQWVRDTSGDFNNEAYRLGDNVIVATN